MISREKLNTSCLLALLNLGRRQLKSNRLRIRPRTSPNRDLLLRHGGPLKEGRARSRQYRYMDRMPGIITLPSSLRDWDCSASSIPGRAKDSDAWSGKKAWPDACGDKTMTTARNSCVGQSCRLPATSLFAYRREILLQWLTARAWLRLPLPLDEEVVD